MKREKIWFWLIIFGFTFAFIVAELFRFSKTVQQFEELLFFSLIYLLMLFPFIMLILWARTRRSRDIWRMLAAIVPSVLIIYIIQYLAPALGWWTGTGVSISPLAHAVIYGSSLTGLVVGAIAFYRLLSKTNKSLAISYYLVFLILITIITYYGDLYLEKTGVLVLRNGYSMLIDIVYVLTIFSLPVLLYEFLNYISYSEQEATAELNETFDRINSQIHSTLDFNEIMRSVVKEAAQALKAESAAIAIQEDGHWSGRYQFGLLTTARPRLTEEEARMASFAIKMKDPIGISNVYEYPRLTKDIIEKYHFRSMLAIPLRTSKSFLGILTFNYHSHMTEFSDAKLDFAKKLQITVAFALQNARLYEVEKQTALLNDKLNEINVAISSMKEIDEIMATTIEASAKTIGCETAAITLREGDYWVLRQNYGFSKEYIGSRFTDEEAKHTVLVERTKEPLAINDAMHDKRINIEAVKSLNIRSALIVPLVIKNNVIGVISFNYHSDIILFSDIEVDFIKKVAVSLSLAIENAQLYAQQQNIADTLQKTIIELPEKIPGIKYRQLYHSATSTSDVGGDFYDLFELEHEKIGVIIGDITGKGLEAATLTSLIKSTIKAYAIEGYAPANIAKKTNEVLVRESSSSTLVTIFFGILDFKTGKLKYCNAGHPPPVIKCFNSKIKILETESPLIGIHTDIPFSEQEITLKPGDILLLYTDGVIEGRIDSKLFGEQRLLGAIKESISLEDMPHHIVKKVIDFTNNLLKDDIAILALSLKEKPVSKAA